MSEPGGLDLNQTAAAPVPLVRSSELREKSSRSGGCRDEKALPEPPECNRPGSSPMKVWERILFCVVLSEESSMPRVCPFVPPDWWTQTFSSLQPRLCLALQPAETT
jgi:hypothetical protein